NECVSHRIFERTLRPLEFRGAHPFECREHPSTFLGFLTEEGLDFGGLSLLASLKPAPPKWISVVCFADP
ncbi:hypothetical protein, partial [Pseudomonas prosekii]|uniref:hypothetical protein n=1 Tax=Pseudomonas prosekii TaxID=1148509 RepID=UPI001C7CBC72